MMTLHTAPLERNASDHARFRLTGWMVLAILVGFFVTVMGVNFFMAYLAIDTFSGLQTDKPYETGLAYNKAIEQAKDQDHRGWQVMAHVERAPSGDTTIEVHMMDSTGAPLKALTLDAILRAPADAKRDQRVTLKEEGDGLYRGLAHADAGQWDVALEAFQDQTLIYQSVNRVILH